MDLDQALDRIEELEGILRTFVRLMKEWDEIGVEMTDTKAENKRLKDRIRELNAEVAQLRAAEGTWCCRRR
jgi:hypothetical protein